MLKGIEGFCIKKVLRKKNLINYNPLFINKNGKLECVAVNACDCKGWKSFIGLRFRNSFTPFDAFIIHLPENARLDSFFVSFPFVAAWLDKDFNVLKVMNCYPNKFFGSVPGQAFVVELPMSMLDFFR